MKNGNVFDTQQTEARLIFNTQGIVRDPFDTRQTETQSTFDTQQIGGAIDIQYCLTEGKRLEDSQINTY